MLAVVGVGIGCFSGFSGHIMLEIAGVVKAESETFAEFADYRFWIYMALVLGLNESIMSES